MMRYQKFIVILFGCFFLTSLANANVPTKDETRIGQRACTKLAARNANVESIHFTDGNVVHCTQAS